MPEIHKFAVYFLFILFYFILHVRQVVLWINNCGSGDLGCFCSAFPPTSDFLCPLQALSPFLFLSSLCSRGAIVSQHHTLRFKTKQNQQTTIHLFSRLLLRCPTMSQHNLGQIQPFEANPHPSLVKYVILNPQLFDLSNHWPENRVDVCTFTPRWVVVVFFLPQNVGKALRATWKCLMLGLYNFALGYSTPITVAATFVPDYHPGRNTSWSAPCTPPLLPTQTLPDCKRLTLTSICALSHVF